MSPDEDARKQILLEKENDIQGRLELMKNKNQGDI